MAVEKVQLNVTLSGGECVWQKGTVLSSPLPPTILKEIELNTGTVSVLETSNNLPVINIEPTFVPIKDLKVETWVQEIPEEQVGYYREYDEVLENRKVRQEENV